MSPELVSPAHLLMGCRKQMKEFSMWGPSLLISCLAGLTALLTTSSLTLNTSSLYASSRSSQPPRHVTYAHPHSLLSSWVSVLSPDLSGSCLVALECSILSVSGPLTHSALTGDRIHHNALRQVVANNLGEPRTGPPKPFSWIPALCPLCFHLHWGRWPAGVPG